MQDRNNPRFTFGHRVLLAAATAVIILLILDYGLAPARDSRTSRVFLPVVGNASTPTLSPTLVSGPSATPTSTATSDPSPIASTGSRLGVWLGGGGDTAVDLLQRTGAKWTRVILEWSIIEPDYAQPARYNFGAYDRLLTALSAAQITPLVEIRSNPSWASSIPCGPIDKPGGLEAFARFLQATAQHYGRSPYNVTHWEFYNEPDNREVANPWGGCWGQNAAEYTTMLQIARGAIKSVDSNAKIVLGGLAFERQPPEFNMDFLDEVLKAGGAAYLDVVNVHYFSNQNPTWSSYGWDIAGKVGAIREILARHGVDKPVFVTELSWTSSAPDSPNTPEQQARYVPKVLARGLNIQLYAMTWFLLSEWNGADYPYGLLDRNLQPRPAYQAYQIAAAEFAGAGSVRPLSPGEVGVESGVEGYAFDAEGQERWVLWAENFTFWPSPSPVEIHLPGRAYEACDKLGQSISLRGDGAPTTLTLDDSPIYVHLQSP